MEINGMVKLGLDLRRGVQAFNVEDKTYSASEASNVLRQALIDANGGSTKLDRKTLRRNKAQIYEIIEQLTDSIIHSGLEGDEFWMNYVDYQNVALGDKNEYWVPDDTTFIVSEIADGIATPRRQRIGHATKVSVSTSIHAIRMYDEYTRFMSNRIDWNELCNKVSKSFDNEYWEDIYAVFNGIDANTMGLSSDYVKTGTYNADTLQEIVDHVESAMGVSATIIGSKLALSKCQGAVLSELAKNAMYNDGFFGKFNGTPMVCLRQRHKKGTSQFVLDNHTVYVIAGGEKFIKFVEEGDAYIDDRDVTRNADKTIEYYVEKTYGVALSISGKVGKYTFTA
jgi:hypothetical protein